MAAPPAIEVAALEKRYGDLLAVDGLSLEVAAGEVFGLLGPNGAGKTTTVEMLEGYRHADAGTVRVLGLDPWRDGAALRPQIGVMLQDGGLYPGIRPLEALRLFASFYDDPDDPERLLALVGLDGSRRTLVRRLSGGQRQRLSLALALDRAAGAGVPRRADRGHGPARPGRPPGRSSASSATEGVTVLLTTHAMDEAEQLCDRVAIVDHGRLVACGYAGRARERRRRRTHAFAAAPGLDPRDLAEALGARRADRPRGAAGGVRGRPHPDAGAGGRLTAWLRDEDVVLTSCGPGAASLEEVFLRLTGEGDP